MTDEQSALKAALAKCYGRERKEHDIRDDDQEGFFTPDSYREGESSFEHQIILVLSNILIKV